MGRQQNWINFLINQSKIPRGLICVGKGNESITSFQKRTDLVTLDRAGKRFYLSNAIAPEGKVFPQRQWNKLVSIIKKDQE